MVRNVFFILCLSTLSLGMEDKNAALAKAIFKKEIFPYMPARTSVTEGKGVAALGQLEQANFDSKHPHWQFKHALRWAKENARDADTQVDIAILKRYIAAIIDKADETNSLKELAKDIKENQDSLRWVVIGDANSAVVSNEQIKDRWNQFMITVSESIPMQLSL